MTKSSTHLVDKILGIEPEVKKQGNVMTGQDRKLSSTDKANEALRELNNVQNDFLKNMVALQDIFNTLSNQHPHLKKIFAAQLGVLNRFAAMSNSIPRRLPFPNCSDETIPVQKRLDAVHAAINDPSSDFNKMYRDIVIASSFTHELIPQWNKEVKAIQDDLRKEYNSATPERKAEIKKSLEEINNVSAKYMGLPTQIYTRLYMPLERITQIKGDDLAQEKSKTTKILADMEMQTGILTTLATFRDNKEAAKEFKKLIAKQDLSTLTMDGIVEITSQLTKKYALPQQRATDHLNQIYNNMLTDINNNYSFNSVKNPIIEELKHFKILYKTIATAYKSRHTDVPDDVRRTLLAIDTQMTNLEAINKSKLSVEDKIARCKTVLSASVAALGEKSEFKKFTDKVLEKIDSVQKEYKVISQNRDQPERRPRP